MNLKLPAAFKRALDRYQKYSFEHEGVKPSLTQIMVQGTLMGHPKLHEFYREEQKKDDATTRKQEQDRQKVERAAGEA